MNILDKVNSILNIQNVHLGYMPSMPDNAVGLFEYTADKPIHSFGNTDYLHNVQVRCRDISPIIAYGIANQISVMLNRYTDADIDIIQTSNVLDIGKDDNNPQRHEYTVNFKIYMKRSVNYVI